MIKREDIVDAIVYSIGDDELTDYDDFQKLDLINEYDLDLHALTDILTTLNTRFDVYVPPREVEPASMNTIDKIVALVESYESHAS